MRKITFIGQVQSTEFAKRKIYDYSNKESKRTNIPELKQRLKEVKESYAKKSLTVQQQSVLKHKQSLNQITIRGMRLNSRAFSKVDPLKEPIANRLKSYKFNKEKQKEFDEVDNWLENRKKRSQVIEPKIESPKPTNNAAPKITSSNTTKSTTSLLQPKSGMGMKGKLGIGAVGLLGTAALSYGVYRKIRSDKGKKRK